MKQKLIELLHHIYMKILKLFSILLPISQPTLFLGRGSLQPLCRSIAAMGIDKVLIVSDKGLEQLGYVARLQLSLDEVGVQNAVYTGVIPDPTYREAEQGVDCYRSNACCGVVALGGGSSMDCAKVIAAMVTNNKPVQRMVGVLKVWRQPAPLFVIPTTAGTGSEVTVAAVVSNPETHNKTPLIDPKLVPISAALDTDFMCNLPASITAQTGMDALTHAIEAFISVNATVETDRYAIAAIRLIYSNLKRTVVNGSDEQERNEMALASYYAGLAFTKASLGYVHAISHAIGAKYSIPHGLANSVLLVPVLKFSLPEIAQRLAILAEGIGLRNKGNNQQESALAFVEYLQELTRTIGLPHQFEDIKEEDIPLLAAQALKEALWNYPVPKLMNKKECERLIDGVRTGRQG